MLIRKITMSTSNPEITQTPAVMCIDVSCGRRLGLRVLFLIRQIFRGTGQFRPAPDVSNPFFVARDHAFCVLWNVASVFAAHPRAAPGAFLRKNHLASSTA